MQVMYSMFRNKSRGWWMAYRFQVGFFVSHVHYHNYRIYNKNLAAECWPSLHCV